MPDLLRICGRLHVVAARLLVRIDVFLFPSLKPKID